MCDQRLDRIAGEEKSALAALQNQGACFHVSAVGAREARRLGEAAEMPPPAVLSSKRPHRASADSDGALAPGRDFPGPERLVGFGFRLWLNGFRTGDISNWERAWSAYAGTIGAAAAKTAVGQLSCWVRAIDCNAQRELKTASNDCAQFCQDECVAIAMIAACQHNACPAMRACAFALLGCSMIEEVVEGADNFAHAMRDARQILSPASAQAASLLLMPSASALSH